MSGTPKVVLTVAGSDSGGGAGIQADLKTFAAFGVYGTSAITAVTAQTTLSVEAVQEIEPRIVAAQIDAVAAAIERRSLPHLVVDPVMVSKSGAVLLRDDAIEALRMRLLPLAEMAT